MYLSTDSDAWQMFYNNTMILTGSNYGSVDSLNQVRNKLLQLHSNQIFTPDGNITVKTKAGVASFADLQAAGGDLDSTVTAGHPPDKVLTDMARALLGMPQR